MTCFSAKNWQLAGTLGIDGIHASFLRKANENVQVAVELEASLRTLESVTTLAYQFHLPLSFFVFYWSMEVANIRRPLNIG